MRPVRTDIARKRAPTRRGTAHRRTAERHTEKNVIGKLTERRYDNSSTIYCSQYGIEDWHRRMGGGAHAESVLDRIIHNAVRIEMGDVNMRERMASKKK